MVERKCPQGGDRRKVVSSLCLPHPDKPWVASASPAFATTFSVLGILRPFRVGKQELKNRLLFGKPRPLVRPDNGKGGHDTRLA
jgi:hypothetical protein